MFKLRKLAGVGNSGCQRYYLSTLQRNVPFQRPTQYKSFRTRLCLLRTTQTILKKRAIGTTATGNSAREPLWLEQTECALDTIQDTEQAVRNKREQKPRSERSSDHRERAFASITQLPPDFFHDVQLLRILANEDQSVGNGVQYTTTSVEAQLLTDTDEESLVEPLTEGQRQTQPRQGSLEIIDRGRRLESGFWPSEAQLSQSVESDTEREGTEVQQITFGERRNRKTIVTDTGSTTTDLARSTPVASLFEILDSSPQRRGKFDLSAVDPLALEASEKIKNTKGYNAPALLFQPYAGLRSVLRKFMDHAHKLVMTSSPGSDDEELDAVLNRILSAEGLHLLSRGGYAVEDLLSWSWILLAPPAQSIRRYAAFSQWQQRHGLPVVPQFVALQLLRSECIDALSLGIYLDETLRIAQNWQWLGPSKSLMAVRLLRHARVTAPDLFEPIINMTFSLFTADTGGKRSKAEDSRLTHWFNRLLSLLALPISLRPFKSMQFQQHAQLEVVRHMQKYKPKIPITREGYRALSEVQLMHKKTKLEQDWARVKDPSWPPWQLHDQMGANTVDDYPGQQSRVKKVLQRMQESGYQLGQSEMAAQVLTGWDTDSSPTIQVRRIGNVVSSRKPWLLGPKFDAAQLPERVWMARIEATRSVREAWMCFCFYARNVQAAQQSVSVYRSMFSKLVAKTIKDRSADAPLPGDGIEVHLDPVLARNRVYIPEAIPTVKELYKRMHEAGVKSNLRLLSDLLNQAETIDEGFRYIEDAHLSPHIKDVLLHPEQVSLDTISQQARRLPDFFLGSYFYLLSRREASKGEGQKRFLLPGSAVSGARDRTQALLPIDFALRMLEITKTSAPYILNNVLRGLRSFTRNRKQGASPTMGLATVWLNVEKVLAHSHDRRCLPDIMTFRNLSYIAQQIQTWSDPRASKLEAAALSSVQEVFMQAVLGKRISADNWIPAASSDHTQGMFRALSGTDIDWMVWHLAYTQNEDTISLVLNFLRWIHEIRSLLNDLNGRKLARFPIIAFRVVLEGSWADQQCWEVCAVKVANEEQREEAQRLCEPFGWATDDEVAEYLRTREQTLKRFRVMMLSRKRLET